MENFFISQYIDIESSTIFHKELNHIHKPYEYNSYMYNVPISPQPLFFWFE